jgi:hypothetical protein
MHMFMHSGHGSHAHGDHAGHGRQDRERSTP